MNVKEHLLVCLTEECSEIIKATDKALRFGLDDGYPGGKTTNLKDIKKEIGHLASVLDLLDAEDFNLRPNYIELYRIKRKKKIAVKKYMAYAKKRGTLI